jgi:hypothetical protein
MGTTGSVDGAGRLVIKGRFQQKQIENVLRRYIGMSLVLYSIFQIPLTHCFKWNTLLAKHVNLPIRSSLRKTVSSSCHANPVDLVALLTPLRAVSKHKSAREAKTRPDKLLTQIGCWGRAACTAHMYPLFHMHFFHIIRNTWEKRVKIYAQDTEGNNIIKK